MDFSNILGSLGGLLGGNKGGANANGGAGNLQDILGGCGLDLNNINPQDIISKFQNGELSKDNAIDAIKQVAAKFGLDDELETYLNKLK